MPTLPADQFVNRIEATLEHFGDAAGAKKARRLVRVLADYVQRTQHNIAASRSDAERVLLLTMAVLAEVEGLVQDAAKADEIVQRHGVFRCPVCRSRDDLKEEAQVEYDSDGPSFAGYMLFCLRCEWAAPGPSR